MILQKIKDEIVTDIFNNICSKEYDYFRIQQGYLYNNGTKI
ncbi:hypothetical protein B0S90_1006 [Caldicellulosiruptor bescii]|uniref:Uncharacterized protein n=2 Tax=Caldicellulosiruptor bescii TaxID=31899 RepID=B9MQ42_CALBD|nr:hypothetical protein Athe_0719 [Caldicellulosiruptor bescii DSM 6725]PBC87246.1 hypothetical protein B0S87_0136 [Caldicellulosiruptor bescii]PBC90185.1 hypothetical protein B0S89_0509 [Caldicellulosiruptor bescii]PBD04386.1 hypothetical protein B0S85_2039 [Caldicellulosiruptor bescii]PBD05982.1 hypothetical protein B0S90_1006 [Caldicellulosiruptor bescii]